MRIGAHGAHARPRSWLRRESGHELDQELDPELVHELDPELVHEPGRDLDGDDGASGASGGDVGTVTLRAGTSPTTSRLPSRPPAAPAPTRPGAPHRGFRTLLPTRSHSDQLLRTGHLLTVSSLLTAGVGVVYWIVATRTYGAAAVGSSYAAVAAMTFLASIGQLNLDAVLIRFVPSAGSGTRWLVIRAYASAACGALVTSTVFVVVVPQIAPGLAFLHAPLLGAAFVVGTGAYAIFALEDGVLTGLRRPGWLVLENLGFAVAKIALILVFAGTVLRGQGILASWVVALLLTVAVTNGLLFPGLNRNPDRAGTRRQDRAPGRRYIGAAYSGQMLWMAAVNLPPIIVLDRLDAEQSAYFSLAWLIAHTLYMISVNMGLSLVVESAREPERIQRFRHMLRHTGLLVAAGTAVTVAAAPLILRLFGAHYERDGVGLLRLLALSAIPNLLIVTAVSIACAEQRMKLVVGVYASICALVLSLTAILVPMMGINGAGVAWLAAMSLVAAALLVRPRVWLPHGPTPPAPGDFTEPPSQTREQVPALTLSVVVCAYTMDRWDDVSAAIGSLRRQVRAPDEVILVVDHCAPLAKRAFRAFDDVRVLVNDEQQGLSGARNTGVRAARGDIVAFLDDDAVAQHRWTEQLLAPYADPDVLGVGGLVRPEWDRGRPTWFPSEFDWVVGCSHRGMPGTRAEVRNFIGANMSFRRALLAGLGGFRHDLGRVGTRPLGGEETELCIRAVERSEGGRLVYQPTAAVRHRVPAGRGTWAYFKARCYAEGLSKAAVTGHTGSKAALASERAYLRRTVPMGFLRPLRPGPKRTSWGTAVALIVGVVWTTAGYASGRIRTLLRRIRPGTLPAGTPQIRTADRAARVVAVAALPAALGLWAYSLHLIRLSAISDLGLITALPPAYWAALALATLGFAVTVLGRARVSAALPAGYVFGLIAMLHATPALAYPTLRYAWAWKHVAIVDLLTAHGSVPSVPSSTQTAAYSQWPGFFALSSLLTQATGARSAESFAAWGPPVFNALMVVPLLLLYRSITNRRRVVWAGVWVYFICSWVGQDYFSPQAYVLLLYVLFGAVVVRRILMPPAEASEPPGPVRTRPGPCARLPWGELAVLLLIAAAVDSSHQLTPVMIVTVVAALSVKRVHRRALAPLLIGTTVLAVAWDATVARPFLAANLHSLIEALGSFDANAGSGLISLAAVSRDQMLIAWIDRTLTAAVFLLAIVALIRRRRLRRSPVGWLALSPIVLLGMSNYGGEIVFRVYLFALPALALAAAALLLRPERRDRQHPRGRAWTLTGAVLRSLAVPAAFAGLLSGLIFAYYGKERANYFTPQEVTAAQVLFGLARPGEAILAPDDDFPGAYTGYPGYRHVFFAQQDPQLAKLVTAHPVPELTALAADASSDLTAYVILTRAQAAEIAQTGALPAGAFAGIEAALRSSTAATIVYQNADAVVFRLDLGPPAAAVGAGVPS